MPSYSINNIAGIIDGKIIGDQDTAIKQLLIDSRNFLSTSETLFFAIKGERHDGHDYLKDLHEKLIKNFVVSKLPADYLNYKDSNFILVEDTLLALQKLAAYHRSTFSMPVLGITGSNGKTGIKEWIFQLLQDAKKIVRSPKSYNSQVGVPLSVWLLEEGFDLAIFEAGISKPGEMEKLQPIINPTIGLFTNIGDAHQESFPDLRMKLDEKLKL
jgi:Alr-MurF fusion protein